MINFSIIHGGDTFCFETERTVKEIICAAINEDAWKKLHAMGKRIAEPDAAAKAQNNKYEYELMFDYDIGRHPTKIFCEIYQPKKIITSRFSREEIESIYNLLV